MRVATHNREYTLYIGATGEWTMHEWNPLAQPGYQWQDTYHNVSARDPFTVSRVTYDAWE